MLSQVLNLKSVNSFYIYDTSQSHWPCFKFSIGGLVVFLFHSIGLRTEEQENSGSVTGEVLSHDGGWIRMFGREFREAWEMSTYFSVMEPVNHEEEPSQ